MDLINGINLYSMQSAKIRKELKTTMGAAEQTEVVKHSTKTETKELPAKDVLGFMANQSVSVKIDVEQTLKVGKFVDYNDDFRQFARFSRVDKVIVLVYVVNDEFRHFCVSRFHLLNRPVKHCDRRFRVGDDISEQKMRYTLEHFELDKFRVNDYKS